MAGKAANPRFEALWGRNCVGNLSGAEIGMALVDFYGQPQRYYHTMDHIEFCLGLFDEVKGQCVHADAVELAIWFHDAVYDFPVADNEKLSAEYFLQVSEGYLPESLRQNIVQQVLATNHQNQPVDKDQQILVDIDLSSFGRPWDRFLKDGKNVRLELGYLDDEEFYRGQIGFMKQLIDRQYFYNVPWFQEQFEATARANLVRYLTDLDHKGYQVS